MGTRVKTFDSTGTAPNGKLYAGDLNGIQDQYADLTNFAQTLDVGTLRVGDSALQLVKFASGEFRLTGKLRTDGAVLPGVLTTTARNALSSPPSGSIIWNSTTGQLEVNVGSSGSPVWAPASRAAASVTVAQMAADRVSAAGGTVNFSASDAAGRIYTPTIQVKDIDQLSAFGVISSGNLVATIPTTGVYEVTVFALNYSAAGNVMVGLVLNDTPPVIVSGTTTVVAGDQYEGFGPPPFVRAFTAADTLKFMGWHSAGGSVGVYITVKRIT